MIMKKSFVWLVVLLFVPVLVHSQHDEKKKVYHTKRINPHPPVIDGRLDDPAWASVEWEGDFTQREPYDGKEPSQNTTFKILYDDKNVYCAIRAHDTEPEKIVQRMSRRDEIDGDWVGIQLDSYFDHLTAFTFIVNAGGVKMDGIFTNDGDNEDWSPDPVWDVKTSVDDGGWSAEFQIPLSQIRFGKKEEHVWGLQVARMLYRKEETDCWQHIPQDATGWVHNLGELHGIQGIKPSRRIELLPYSLGRMERMEEEAGNPFVPGHDYGAGLGLDGKIGVTSDLTLDFTINPDFGQVEADPSVVNLTAFETFYEEKRPFFIEGSNILNYRMMLGDGDFSYDNLFYSRRIGRYPHHEPDLDDDEYANMPENSSILGAMKLTGKTKNGLSVGIMNAVTARERAEIDYLGQRRDEAVEPMTNYFLGRLQQDVNKGNTIFGGIITHTYRDIKDTELEFLNRNAITEGVDFVHQWKDKTYALTFNSVFSHVRGTQEAILETQTASARYFQRPDAEHITLDSSRTSLSGFGGSLVLSKSGSGHINFALGGTWRSPGLELNDMGYLRQADKIMEFVWAQYRVWEPFSIFQRFNINVNQWCGWDFAMTKIFEGGNINGYIQFRNYWGFGFGIGYNAQSLSASSLRGGPSMLFPSRWNAWANLSTDSKKAFQFGLSGFISRSDDDYSVSSSLEPSVTWRPSNALSFSVRPFYNINKDDLQYIDTIENGEDRYIFGRIDQKTTGLVLRLNYSITPNLTIQYYGQPFVSAGKYTQLKQITQPRAPVYSDRFHIFASEEIAYNSDDEEYQVDEDIDGTADYTFENPDFNFRQFRSNLVIRWEYTPGSTIFLVWSQNRTSEESMGDFSFRNDMRGLFQVHPHNVFLIKVNRWFSL